MLTKYTYTKLWNSFVACGRIDHLILGILPIPRSHDLLLNPYSPVVGKITMTFSIRIPTLAKTRVSECESHMNSIQSLVFENGMVRYGELFDTGSLKISYIYIIIDKVRRPRYLWSLWWYSTGVVQEYHMSYRQLHPGLEGGLHHNMIHMQIS